MVPGARAYPQDHDWATCFWGPHPGMSVRQITQFCAPFRIRPGLDLSGRAVAPPAGGAPVLAPVTPPSQVPTELRLLVDVLKRADIAASAGDIDRYSATLSDLTSRLPRVAYLIPETESGLVELRDAIADAVHIAGALESTWRRERHSTDRAVYLTSELARPPYQRGPEAVQANLDLARRRQAEAANERTRLVAEFQRHLDRCDQLVTAPKSAGSETESDRRVK